MKLCAANIQKIKNNKYPVHDFIKNLLNIFLTIMFPLRLYYCFTFVIGK